MFIIFDLDDTLIDTSGTVTPIALEYALERVPVDAPLEELLTLNKTAYSSFDAWQKLLKRYDAGEYIEDAVQAIQKAPIDAITPLPGALELLRLLAVDHRMAIVTIGDEMRQLEKLRLSGFDKKLFESIHVTPKRDKKKIYQELLAKWKTDPFNILVVGDRVTTDLQPAKELGMRTCHIEWGRGQNNTGSKRYVDVTINALTQVKAIAYEYQNH